MPKMKERVELSEAAVNDLCKRNDRGETMPEKRGVYRDCRQPSFMLRVGAKVVSYYFEAERTGHDGKRQFIAKHLGHPSEVSARDAFKKAQVEAGSTGTAPPGVHQQVTLEQAMAAHFSALRKTGKSHRHAQENETRYKRHIKARFGRHTLKALSEMQDDIVAMHDEITAAGKKTEADTCCRLIQACYFRYQSSHPGKVPAWSPCSAVTYNPRESRSDKAMPWDAWANWNTQCEAIAATRPLAAAHHKLCFLLGLRPGEVGRARFDAFDPIKHTLAIGKTKTGKDVLVPTTPEIEAQIEICTRAKRGSPHMFPAKKSRTGYLRDWREASDAATLSHRGHAGRYSFKTLGKVLGIDDFSLRLLQGHSLTGVADGYISSALLTGTTLADHQARISKAMTMLWQGVPIEQVRAA